MKTKILAIFTLLLFWCALCTTAAGNYSQEGNEQKISIPRLVRKELLEKEKEDLSPPRRNIFMPDYRGQLSTELNDTDPGADPSGILEPQDDPETDSHMSTMMELRYVGYISSSEKTIAIILFEGQALAVAKDDAISEDIKVVSITREAIEIIGPDAIVKKVSIEGEDL